jgi:hypothetical protein
MRRVKTTQWIAISAYGLNSCMRIFEFANNHSVAPTKPQTPAQARIRSLQQQKDSVNRALQAERKRQRIARAQQSLARATAPPTAIPQI